MNAFRIAAITDEFSPEDLDAALAGMAAVGMTGAELRVVGGRNMIDLSDEEVDRVRAAVETRGRSISAPERTMIARVTRAAVLGFRESPRAAGNT